MFLYPRIPCGDHHGTGRTIRLTGDHGSHITGITIMATIFTGNIIISAITVAGPNIVCPDGITGIMAAVSGPGLSFSKTDTVRELIETLIADHRWRFRVLRSL